MPSSASARLDQHLAAAIKEFSAPKKSEPAMRGMKRLANLTENLLKNMDAEADAAADEIQQAHTYAQGAIGKFREQGKEIRRTADDILSQLGQTSNMDDAETGDGSQASTADGLPKNDISSG